MALGLQVRLHWRGVPELGRSAHWDILVRVCSHLNASVSGLSSALAVRTQDKDCNVAADEPNQSVQETLVESWFSWMLFSARVPDLGR